MYTERVREIHASAGGGPRGGKKLCKGTSLAKESPDYKEGRSLIKGNPL